jgi:hypothetical protein
MMIQHGSAGLASRWRIEGHRWEIKFLSKILSRMPPAVKICYSCRELTGVLPFLSGNEIVVIDRSAVAASHSGPPWLDAVLALNLR